MNKTLLILSFLNAQALATPNQGGSVPFDQHHQPHDYLFHYEIGSSLDVSEDLLKQLDIKKPGKRKSVIKVTVTDESGQAIDPEQVSMEIDATNTFWQEKIRTVVKTVDQNGHLAYYAGFRANQGETVYFLIEADIGETELAGRFQHRFDLRQ